MNDKRVRFDQFWFLLDLYNRLALQIDRDESLLFVFLEKYEANDEKKCMWE
jgi:hypothetical protein